MKKITKELEIAGRTLTLTTGQLAPQADIAVRAQYGDTVVLVSVVASPLTREVDYFPLSVEYQERLYAGGRIKGSRWVKREGRPTDNEILIGRLIDRSIRPLFPKTYKKEVQVIATVLSVDMQNDPGIVAAMAVSAALSASSLPWAGPISISNVGFTDGEYFLNSLTSQDALSEMDLVVSATRDAIVMIEAGAKEVSEEVILGGIAFAQKEGKKFLDFADEFAKAVGNEKEVVEKKETDKELKKIVEKLTKDTLPDIIHDMALKYGKSERWNELLKTVATEVGEEKALEALMLVDDLKKEHIRSNILKGKRPDGRKLTQVRVLSSEVAVLPRTHGSAIFQREATQVMSVVTIGPLSMGQLFESAEGEYEKRYIHHYVMPPYSTGETGRVGSPGRREIGHGALAERALEPVLPSEEDFPYAVRVVSEVLSSNGSTSMASTCGSTLSLMDAGVPISAPVSGIAMGLVIEDEKNFAVMTDIAGIEDFNGDMDFKVAGTSKGITALQLDVKTLNLTHAIMTEAIAQAKVGRKEILDHMLSTLDKPRADISPLAPKVKSIKIDLEKIGELIGPSGKTVKKIIAESGAQVDIGDTGLVSVSGVNGDSVEKALTMIRAIVTTPEPGQIFEGEVKRVQPFGAFVEILPGKEGLVHVSDMSTEYVSNPEDLVTLGQKVTVRVKEVDNMGRLNLSMVLDPAYDQEKEQSKPPRRGGGSGGNSGGSFGRPRFSERRDDRPPRRFQRNDRREGSGGPHFPTSRLVSSDAPKNRFGR